jgi:hypothetical protein
MLCSDSDGLCELLAECCGWNAGDPMDVELERDDRALLLRNT